MHEKVVQFVLAGATLPSHGKKSVANYVQSKFPHVSCSCGSSSGSGSITTVEPVGIVSGINYILYCIEFIVFLFTVYTYIPLF